MKHINDALNYMTNTMIKQYRIKTEQEFIEEYGEKWRNIVGWNFEGCMDYLFGRFLETPHTSNIDNKWYIFTNMITDKPLPLTELQKEYCVEVVENSDEAKELAKWLNENTLVNGRGSGTFRGDYNLYSVCKDGSSWGTDRGYQRISFQTWKNLINMEKKENKIIGYKLIKKYPGSRDVGYIEKIEKTHQHPDYYSDAEFWEPIYEQEKEILALRCHHGTFAVEVSAEGVYYEPGKTWLDMDKIEKIIEPSAYFVGHSKNVGRSGSYIFEFRHIDSGCKKQVPIEDWKKVLETYKKFKK